MANENILEIQRDLVAMERAKAIAKADRLKKDIRSQIARNGFYNPEADPIYEYREFPKWITRPDGQKLIVNNKAEEAEHLGIKAEPARAVTIDTNQLEGVVQTAPAKRGRPKKVVPAPLPPDLD